MNKQHVVLLAIVTLPLGCNGNLHTGITLGSVQGSADAADAPGPDAATERLAPSLVNLSGRWAMFTFEDPLAVELTHDGNALVGRGCADGLPSAMSPRNDPQFCAALSGHTDGARVVFSLDSTFIPYAADVYVSSDGSRMAGRFHGTGGWALGFAWLRIGPDDAWLKVGPALPIDEAVKTRGGTWTLQPVGVPPTEIEVDASGYRLLLIDAVSRGVLMHSTLGSFFRTEMAWNEAEQALVMGPVPVTSPKLPTKVVLRFNGTTLLDVAATMPSGAVHAFTAAAL